MHPTPEDRAIEAQGAGPLTPLQIRTLAVEARRAWEVQRRLGLAPEDFDAWRHAAVQDAAPGRRGLRDLTQADFVHVRDWLKELAGGARPVAKDGDDDARRARWRLRRTLDALAWAFGGKEEARRYADALFRDIHRTTFEEATARQVWQVVFTVKNRADAKAGDWTNAPAGRRRFFPTHPGKARRGPGRRGAAGNGESAARNAPRVFP